VDGGTKIAAEVDSEAECIDGWVGPRQEPHRMQKNENNHEGRQELVLKETPKCEFAHASVEKEGENIVR